MARSASGKIKQQSEEKHHVCVVTSKMLGTGNALLQLGVTLPGVTLAWPLTCPVTLNKLLKLSVPHFPCL